MVFNKYKVAQYGKYGDSNNFKSSTDQQMTKHIWTRFHCYYHSLWTAVKHMDIFPSPLTVTKPRLADILYPVYFITEWIHVCLLRHLLNPE
jgi:hypothetical protein